MGFGDARDMTPYEEEFLRQKRRDKLAESVKSAALSGGISGASVGAVARLLAGKRAIPEILLGAAGAGATSAALGAGATYVGGELLGPASDKDPSAYTKRGGIGGAVGGGLLGAAVGGLAGAGKVKLPKFAANNLIGDALAKLAANPSARTAKLGALLGGTVLGGSAGYLGADEGMQLDFLTNEANAARRRRMMKKLAGAGEDTSNV